MTFIIVPILHAKFPLTGLSCSQVFLLTGHKRKAKTLEENDYYDSDEDNFLDRTGDGEGVAIIKVVLTLVTYNPCIMCNCSLSVLV